MSEDTKHISYVWKVHYQFIKDHLDDMESHQTVFNLIFKDLWQAIEKDLEGKQ